MKIQEECVERDLKFWGVAINHQNISMWQDVLGVIHDFKPAPQISMSLYSLQTFSPIKMATHIFADLTGGVLDDIIHLYSNHNHKLYNFVWVVRSPYGGVSPITPFEFITSGKSCKMLRKALANLRKDYERYYGKNGKPSDNKEMFADDMFKFIHMDCDLATMEVSWSVIMIVHSSFDVII